MNQEFQPSHVMVENLVDGALPREEYFSPMVHQDRRVAVPEPAVQLAPQHGWQCKSGMHNFENRCFSCQEWKAGDNNSTNNAQPTWDRGGNQNQYQTQQDWACDACGNLNGYNKVRCVACPRWKDGKRPNLKPTVETPGEANMVMLQYGNWMCQYCSIVNLAKKARCRHCQGWKGGRRENMPKRNGNVNNHEGSTPWTCDVCAHVNAGVKQRCGSCQHWKQGKRLNMRAKARSDSPPYVPPAGSIFPRVPDNNPWHCVRCGNNNEGAKLRCGSCRSWKSGKLQMSVFAAAPAVEPLAGAIAPWLCGGCSYMNTVNIQQCESCQCWRSYETMQRHGQINDQTNNSQSYNQNDVNNQIYTHEQYTQPLDPSVAFLPPSLPAPQVVEEAQAKQQNPQQLLPWVCLGCSKENLGSKARCGGCQKWKGGVRENLKSRKRKAASETWACHRCTLQNAGNKVRCKSCQCWKDGGRPDVIARKQEKAARKADATMWWPCDRCSRLNKPKNQRCGGCLRWRDGSRPGLKKKADDARPALNQFPVVPYAPPRNRNMHPHVDANEYPHVQDSSWACHKGAYANLATDNPCTMSRVKNL